MHEGPTEAEINQRIAENELARERVIIAVGPRPKGSPTKTGAIPCPVCKTGELRYLVAARNGHVHATCTTAGCVSFME